MQTLAYNPFETILQRIDTLENRMIETGKVIPIEIIDRAELCKRLDISEPTCIAWERKGKLPSLRIGSAVRYNWPKVVASLENY